MILIKGKLYDRLKFLALIALPALGTLYFTLSGIWGLPKAEEVVSTILAIDTFLGVILQLSSTAYKKSDAAYDGDVIITKTDEKDIVELELKEDPHGMPTHIDKRGELRFKVKKTHKAKI